MLPRMLDPDAIDLDELGHALDSRNLDEMSWWINPATGEIRPHVPDVDGDETPEELGWSHVRPAGSRDGYRDMSDFVAAVPDRAALADANRVVDAVEAWIAARPPR